MESETFEFLENENTLQNMTQEFSQVIFEDIFDTYPSDSDIITAIKYPENFIRSDEDRVLLFEVGWTSVNDYLHVAELRNDYVKLSGQAFSKDVNCLYQLCYCTSENRIVGVSTPFNFHLVREEEVMEYSRDEDDSILTIKSRFAILMDKYLASLDKSDSQKNSIISSDSALVKDKSLVEDYFSSSNSTFSRDPEQTNSRINDLSDSEKSEENQKSKLTNIEPVKMFKTSTSSSDSYVNLNQEIEEEKLVAEIQKNSEKDIKLTNNLLEISASSSDSFVNLIEDNEGSKLVTDPKKDNKESSTECDLLKSSDFNLNSYIDLTTDNKQGMQKLENSESDDNVTCGQYYDKKVDDSNVESEKSTTSELNESDSGEQNEYSNDDNKSIGGTKKKDVKLKENGILRETSEDEVNFLQLRPKIAEVLMKLTKNCGNCSVIVLSESNQKNVDERKDTDSIYENLLPVVNKTKGARKQKINWKERYEQEYKRFEVELSHFENLSKDLYAENSRLLDAVDQLKKENKLWYLRNKCPLEDLPRSNLPVHATEYLFCFPHGFRKGTHILIETIANGPNWFTMELNGTKTVNVDFIEQDNSEEFKFMMGSHTPILIKMLCRDHCFEVFVNEKISFYHIHSVDPATIMNVVIKTTLKVNKVVYKKTVSHCERCLDLEHRLNQGALEYTKLFLKYNRQGNVTAVKKIPKTNRANRKAS